jgi:EpsI family protein
MSSHLRFALAAFLLLATALFLHCRGGNEVMAPRQPLPSFPLQLGSWAGTDVPISEETLRVLGPGDFLLRIYENQKQQQDPDIDLFIAYFPSQRMGDTIHSPKHCLPGAGWLPVESGHITVWLPGQTPFPANRYVIAKRGQRQLVLYWYLAHARPVASEYWAKFYLVADSIRLNRSDGALIRVITSLSEEESVDSAQQRLFSFMANLVPRLDVYVPR